MNYKFTQKAQNALAAAQSYAREMGHTYIGSEHFLLGLASEKDGIASKLLEGLGVSCEQLKDTVAEFTGTGSTSSVSAVDMTPRAKRIIEIASEEARKRNQTYIGTEYLLISLLSERDCVAVRMLESHGIAVSELKNSISTFLGNTGGHKTVHSEEGSKTKNTNTTSSASAKQETIAGAPVLSVYGRNLTKMATEGRIDPIIGRDRETERVIQILSRRSKNNPCLIGEPGVGKTAVVEGLAQRIADGTVPETLCEKSIVTLDIPSMIAGAKYRGEFEERMKNVMNEVCGNKDIILFIDEIHTIIGAGSAEGAMDAANILKPALSRGEIQLIGATTVSEYRKHIEKDAALERRFQSVSVGEPTVEETIAILEGLRDKYEAHHKLKISQEALIEAVNLSKRYIPDRFLPDKAIDLIDEAASKLRMIAHTTPPRCVELENRLAKLSHDKEEAIRLQNFEMAARIRDEEQLTETELKNVKEQWNTVKHENILTVTAHDVADVVTSWTGIPLREIEKTENEKLLRMEEEMKRMVIGQNRAVSSLSRAIRRRQIGLKDPHRPIGSFLFLGPTGVGKTELTKVLSKILFGDANAMIRLDMSEYMEKHSVSKLIGSPPGYVGYDEGGQLTEKVRRRPYSVVLFDEIEKGHPDVFHLLLQILEDGVLTDSQGRHVDFKNTILIMTSNVGSSELQTTKKVGFSTLDSMDNNGLLKEIAMVALKKIFRPELINRIDEIIVFDPLTHEDVRAIAKLFLEELADRVRRNMRIDIVFEDGAVDLIAAKGYDPTNGARPLRRVITQYVEDALSDAILDGSITEETRVCVKASDGLIVLEPVSTDSIH